MKHWKIAIVGSGAIGLYYGGLLHRKGYDVTFLLRSDYDAVKEHGISIRTGGEEWKLPDAKGARSTSEIGTVDLVIISTKATSNDSLVEMLRPLVGEKTALLPFQNGLGCEELLADAFGADRVLGGLCFVCLNRVAPGVVEHFGHGSLSIGEFTRKEMDRPEKIVAAFREAGVETRAAASLMTERWRKLVWNVPFNGLSIAGGELTTDIILADDGLCAEARALMHEVIAAARGCGYEIPTSFAEHEIDRTRVMGPYKTSSLIDYQNSAPVEVEAIWGEPLRRAEAAGVAVPRMRMLYALLRQLVLRRANGAI